MRILCVNLIKTSHKSVAEVFLKLSPRVQFRAPQWVFIDVAPTLPLFQSEAQMVEECGQICQQLQIKAQLAIADTPWAAQILSQFHEEFITTPGEDLQALQSLPVSSLVWLEGLRPWNCPPQHLQQIASFLQMLGLSTLGQIHTLNLSSWQERWGVLGEQIWQRLHHCERQVISPLVPSEPLRFYQHLDFPISLVSFLLRQLEKAVIYLFARLEGRGQFAERLKLILHCEYSDARLEVNVAPVSASRDRSLFLTLLEQKLSSLNLENPIREFEINLISCAEKQQQLNFWQPQASDQDKLERLISLLQQTQTRVGFYQLCDAILPEQSWQLSNQPASYTPIADTHSRGKARAPETKTPSAWGRQLHHQLHHQLDHQLDHQLKEAYGKPITEAFRPTRLLSTPRLLKKIELKGLRFLSQNPIERLESPWWQEGLPDEPQSRPPSRDYFYAVSDRGQCLWVYRDHHSQAYYVHGYFD